MNRDEWDYEEVEICTFGQYDPVAVERYYPQLDVTVSLPVASDLSEYQIQQIPGVQFIDWCTAHITTGVHLESADFVGPIILPVWVQKGYS